MPVEELASGTQLSKYRITGQLGRGGMGIVYAGLDTTLLRRVAIKLLTNSSVQDQADLKRYLSEARAAACLNHPNVVTVYDVRHNEQGFFIVMELVEGKSADALMKAEGKIPWQTATQIVADACRGLASAHAAGMIHRDVKPSNLLLTKEGVAKLADFGLTEVAHLNDRSAGMIVGTPQYMSPEQCGGEALDERADLYSLGATYFALLTGRPPFDGAEPAPIMYAQCCSPAPDPRTYSPDVPTACYDIIRKAMSKSRVERFESAQTMLEALQGVLNPAATSLSTQSSAPRSARRSLPRIVKRRLIPLVAFAAVVPLVVWLALGNTRPPRSSALAGTSRPFQADSDLQLVLRPQLNAAIAHQGSVKAVCVGERYVVSGGSDGTIHVSSRERGNVLHTMHHPVAIDTVALSPDDKIVVVGGRTSMAVSRWDAETGKPLGVLQASSNVCCLAFAPTGDQLAIAGEADLTLYNCDSSARFRPGRRLLQEQYVVSVVAFSADGKHLVACSDSGDAYVWSLPTFERTTVPAKFPSRITTASITSDGSWITFGSHEGAAYIWQVGAGLPVAWKENLNCIMSSACAPQLATVVFAGEWGGPLRVFDLRKREMRSIRSGIGGAVMAVAFAADGRTFAAAGTDGNVRLWDVVLMKPGEEHNAAVR